MKVVQRTRPPVHYVQVGKHGKIYYWPFQAVNIWLGGHRVLVLGRGRCLKNGKFNRWLPSAYVMNLKYCCGRNGGYSAPEAA